MSEYYNCPECGYVPKSSEVFGKPKYCPKCGAKLVKGCDEDYWDYDCSEDEENER